MNKRTISIIVGFIVLILLCILVFILLHDKEEVEDSNEEPKIEEKKEELFSIKLEDINFMELSDLNRYIQIALAKDRTALGKNIYRFESINNNEEVLNTDAKKFDFAFAYALDSSSDILQDNEVSKTLNVESATGIRAIPLNEMKRVYKYLFNKELPNTNKYPSNINNQGKVINNYVLGVEYTSNNKLGTELNFETLNKNNNTYTLLLSISYLKEGSNTYNKSNDKLVLTIIKNDNYYSINSIILKKGN